MRSSRASQPQQWNGRYGCIDEGTLPDDEHIVRSEKDVLDYASSTSPVFGVKGPSVLSKDTYMHSVLEEASKIGGSIYSK